MRNAGWSIGLFCWLVGSIGIAGCGGTQATCLCPAGTHCDASGKTCAVAHATAACVNGACMPGSCAAGWGDCNNMASDGCEANLHIDPKNCGKCGSACTVKNGIPACSDGCYLAACNFGFDDCNM